MFTAALLTRAKTWKQPICPSAFEGLSKMWAIHTVGHHSPWKGSSDTGCNTREPRHHGAEWNKPLAQEQILCDSTYMRYSEEKNHRDSRMVGARGWGWVSVSRGQSFNFTRWRVTGMDGGDGCTTTRLDLVPLSCALKSGQCGKSLLHVFYRKKKKVKQTHTQKTPQNKTKIVKSDKTVSKKHNFCLLNWRFY